MKRVFLLLIIAMIVSCKNELKKEVSKKEADKEIKNENFPDELGKVFQTHGGIDIWRKAQTLSFNIGEEVHTSDLHSRKIVTNSSKYSIGFNGNEVWLDQENCDSFKGNKDFYYNLYFYFYAMPFVLADHGIAYEKVDDLVFQETNYPGYKISYQANVGTSPDDNYIVYYNSKTFQMEWLAYTVTFKAKKPNDSYHIVKYNRWGNTNGLVLPKEIIWYKTDETGMPTAPERPATKFTLPLISEVKLADSFFEKPIK